MAKKQRETTSNVQPDTLEEITPIVCCLKHEAIDKEFSTIKTDGARRHEEIKELIESIKKDVKNSHDNLKDKIVLVDKTVGDKIDSLSEFDDTLKGNGRPGIWESIRNLRWQIRGTISFIVIVAILWIGGSIKGITMEKIKSKLGFGSAKTKQVETAKPVKEVKLSAMPKG